jgi:glycerol-3-phosphate acyltransferase PlsY
MTPFNQVLLTVPFAYLLGSVPFGLIVGKSKGVDPRTAGSGNIGATNVGRLLGKRFFILVFLLDLMKGLLPMLFAGGLLDGMAEGATKYALWLLVGFTAILGHMYSIFLGMAGGKGVATSSGVVLGLFPYFTVPGLFCLLLWFVTFKVSRYVSLASILAAVAFPVIYVAVGLWRGWPVFHQQWPLLGFAVLVAVMIVVKHRGNIARLRAGTENRFERSPKDAPDAARSASESPTVGV